MNVTYPTLESEIAKRGIKKLQWQKESEFLHVHSITNCPVRFHFRGMRQSLLQKCFFQTLTRLIYFIVQTKCKTKCNMMKFTEKIIQNEKDQIYALKH